MKVKIISEKRDNEFVFVFTYTDEFGYSESRKYFVFVGAFGDIRYPGEPNETEKEIMNLIIKSE